MKHSLSGWCPADGSFHYCYTGQAVVDSVSQMIVVNELNNVAVDVEQFHPMIEKTQVTFDRLPDQILADAGYCSNKNLDYGATLETETDSKTLHRHRTGEAW